MKQYAVLLFAVIGLLFTGGCRSYLDKRELSGLDALVPDGAVVKEDELPRKLSESDCIGFSVVAFKGEREEPVKWDLQESHPISRKPGEPTSVSLDDEKPYDTDGLLSKLLSYSKEKQKKYLWVYSYVWSDRNNLGYYRLPYRNTISRKDYDDSWSDRLGFEEATNPEAEYESSTPSTKRPRDGYLYPTADPADRVLNPIDNRRTYIRKNDITRSILVRGLLFDVESGEFLLDAEIDREWVRPNAPPGYNAYRVLMNYYKTHAQES